MEAGGSRARVITSRDPAVPCCGSAVLGVSTAPVPELRRAVSVGTVRLTGMPLQGVDVFPPGRITDLRADVDPERRTVTLQWTAPGDDYDRSDGRGEQRKGGGSGGRRAGPDQSGTGRGRRGKRRATASGS